MIISALVYCELPADRSTDQATLRVAAAANVQYAMKALEQAFEQSTGINCDIIAGSSGKLTAQIQQGAPYDVFVSANMKYPEELYQSGTALYPPEVYAYGQLVLWTFKEGLTMEVTALSDQRIKKIAIANPKLAPYGEAAVEAMKKYNVYDQVKDRLVFGESISQTNLFIVSQTADIGFTAKSVVLSPELSGQGFWQDVPPGSYIPITQGVVILSKKESARQFYQFLFSEAAHKILEQYGYGLKIERNR